MQDIARAYDLMEAHQALDALLPHPPTPAGSAHGGAHDSGGNDATTPEAAAAAAGLRAGNGRASVDASTHVPGFVPEWDLVAVLGLSHHPELAAGSAASQEARAAAQQRSAARRAAAGSRSGRHQRASGAGECVPEEREVKEAEVMLGAQQREKEGAHVVIWNGAFAPEDARQ